MFFSFRVALHYIGSQHCAGFSISDKEIINCVTDCSIIHCWSSHIKNRRTERQGLSDIFFTKKQGLRIAKAVLRIYYYT